ncbi:MAG TPA: hypothetical protein VFX58_12595, partial [Chitinophagaceae bacterium]|nr:hypothetical protein [Chitinophagaceae bacterium]
MSSCCRHMVLCLLFIIPALQVSLISHTQTDSTSYIISHKILSVEDGLASREIFCGLQDNAGFLWFGTRNGLNRYDGKNFKLFTSQKDSLFDNKVIQLAKDQANHLLIVYGHPGYSRMAMRIEVMDLATNRVQSLKATYPQLPFKEEYVYWVINDGNDLCFLSANPFQYWRLTERGFELKFQMKEWDAIIPETRKQPVLKPNNYAHSGRYSHFYNGDAALYVGERNNIYFLTASGAVQVKPENTPPVAGFTPQHELLVPDTLNCLQLITAAGNKTAFRNLHILPIPKEILDGHYVRDINSADLLYYSQSRGLFLYDHKAMYKLMDGEDFAMAGNLIINQFFTDSRGNRWICTSGGLIRIKLDKNLFTHYFTRALIGAITNNQVRGIYANEYGTVY